MYPALRMAEERPLKMDSKRHGPTLAVRILPFAILRAFSFALFDRIRQPFQRAQSRIHWSGDGGGKVTRDSMPREQLLDRRQRLGAIVHDVVSSAAVNVKINVTRRHHAIAEVGHGNSGGSLSPPPSGNFEDASLLDEQERMLDGIRGSQ